MAPPAFPAVEFTTVVVNGRNGAGNIDLSAGEVIGPFAPAEHHQVISIREGADTYPHDDVTGFASAVGAATQLYQYDSSDLSGAILVVTLARLSWAAEDVPVGVSPSYFAIFTTLGLQRLAEAQYAAVPLVFTQLAVGDGGGAAIDPNDLIDESSLVNEMARVSINNVEISPDAPTTVRVEGLIPAATGGFWIREAGIFNAAGEMIAVASYPPIYKPIPAEGVSVEEYIRILLEYASAEEAIALTVDPDVVTATRLYVDARVQNYGDGSDGDLTFDGGGGTVAGATLAGSTYTATRDIFAEDCTVTGAGVRLAMDGYRLYVRGTLTTEGGAKISNNGGTPTTHLQAGWSNSGTLLKGGRGAAGVTSDINAAPPSNMTNAYGGAGGAGGTSSSGKTGAAGTVSEPGATRGSWRLYSPVTVGHIIGLSSLAFTGTPLDGGGGGGGGGGSGAGNSGAGGNGGGVLVVVARFLDLEDASDIEVRGGDGAPGLGGSGSTGSGGGGGGGGGLLLLVYGTKRPDLTFSDAVNCPGGEGGAGYPPGADGSDGSPGQVLALELVAA